MNTTNPAPIALFGILFLAVVIIIIYGLANAKKNEMKKIIREYNLQSLEDLGEVNFTNNISKYRSTNLFRGLSNNEDIYILVQKISGAKGLGSYYSHKKVSYNEAKVYQPKL